MKRVGPADKEDQPVIIKLRNVQDKGKVFENVPKLKGKTNAKRRLFYVNDDLDPEQAEQRNKFQQLLKDKKDNDYDYHVKLQQNRLIVNNMVIRPHVKAPMTADILRLTDQEREHL